MATFPPNTGQLMVLMIATTAAWGFACGLCEKFLLAPRRRLSSVGAAYFPAMTLALAAGTYFLVSENEVRFFFAILMAGVFFGVGALPALAVFHLSRRILRTQFSNETKS